MTTSSYQDQTQYAGSVERDWNPKITPSGSIPREKAKELLDPNDPENLNVETDGQYSYVPDHVSSRENREPKQGWTEKKYVSDLAAGGAVRNALLSGSYGELRKLRVDSEVNSETVTTSWSASIGENLRVGNNVGVAGYVNLGDTASLATGSSQPGQDPVQGFAPNSEGISDVRLIVSDSAIIQKDFYVKNNTSISGSLVVSGTVNLGDDLFVSGNATVSKSVKVGKDLAVTGSTDLAGTLTVKGDTTLKKNLTVSGSSTVIGDFQVKGTSSLRDVYILGNLQVNGTASYLNVDDLYVKDKLITLASGSTSPEQVDGAGIHIEGANVLFQYNSQTDRMTLNKGLDIEGSASAENLYIQENITAGDTVSSVTGSFEYLNVSSSASINNLNVAENINVGGTVSASYFYGDGSNLRNVTASVVSSSTWKSYIDFEAGSTQSVTHPFQTTDVFVQVYRWDDPNFHPDLDGGSSFSSPATRVNDATVKIIENGLVEISYGSALNGYAVISDAGMIITASVDLLQVATDRCEYSVSEPKAIYRFDHKLGTTNVIVSVYQYADPKDGSGVLVPVQIFPEQISIPDKSHIDIVFGRAPISGYVVIAKAGHVVKQFDIGDFIDTYNIHYGTEGNWLATSFAANTMSGDIVVAANYVDAHKIGNLNTGPQYYYQRTWGSYTEYTDTGINEYVRYSADDDADVRQVSNINRNGDLTIRGRLITNGTFSTSDIRKKFNIETLSNALENVERMRGVQFQWNDSGERGIGVVAQEINTIYPELTKVVTNLDGSEQMVVNYEGLVGVLIEAVKNLSTKVSLLERQILKNENR